MITKSEREKGALYRMGVVRIPSSAIASARVKIKRALRKEGVTVPNNASTRTLIRELTKLRKSNPEVHIDIDSHNTKGRNVRAKNPRSRSKKPVTRASQASGKRPTSRLVKRRKATLKAPKGYFANPIKSFTHFIEESQPGSRPGNVNWKTVGMFKTREEAIQYGRARADASKQVVRYRKAG